MDFIDEKRFDVIHAGNKSTRDKCLVNLINSPAIRAAFLEGSKPIRASTSFLSSNPNGRCVRMKILLQEKHAGINYDNIKEETVAIVDKLLEYKVISKKQHIFLINEFHILDIFCPRNA